MRFGFVFEITLPVFILLWGAFMIYGAFFSDTGYRTLNELRVREAQMNEGLSVLTAKRRWMENRAELMDSGNLDPDMVDERIRNVLGYADERDIVITRKELKQAIAFMKDDNAAKFASHQLLIPQPKGDIQENYATNFDESGVVNSANDPLAAIIAQSLLQ